MVFFGGPEASEEKSALKPKASYATQVMAPASARGRAPGPAGPGPVVPSPASSERAL